MGTVRGRRWLGLLVGCAVLTGGCTRQDTERLARIGRKAVEHTEALTGDLRERLGSGWQAADAGVAGRVAARLHWDRSLADANITVQLKEDAIELRGNVADLPQRRRAVDLAETTVGVRKVIDLLEMPGARP
jgi:osmotically-inducible protein OsmY